MLGKFCIGDVLPSSHYLSAWIVEIAMMLNDIVVATSSFERILHDNRPTMNGERLYWYRLASSHYREAVKFLAGTSSEPTVVQFVQHLPLHVQDAYKMILDNSSKPGTETLFGKDVVSTRNLTFHYPYVTDVQNALERMQDREGAIALNGQLVKEFRAIFADEILLDIMGYNEETWRDTVKILGEWTGAFIKFSNHAVCFYLDIYSEQIHLE